MIALKSRGSGVSLLFFASRELSGFAILFRFLIVEIESFAAEITDWSNINRKLQNWFIHNLPDIDFNVVHNGISLVDRQLYSTSPTSTVFNSLANLMSFESVRAATLMSLNFKNSWRHLSHQSALAKPFF